MSLPTREGYGFRRCSLDDVAGAIGRAARAAVGGLEKGLVSPSPPDEALAPQLYRKALSTRA